jgi:hypothetical protein
MSSLTVSKKELRKNQKRQRQLKKNKGSWNLNKIQDLEKEENIILEKIKIDDERKEEKKKLIHEKEKVDNMSFDEMIIYYQSKDKGNIEIESHKIPNNKKTRKKKKQVLKNLQDHFVSENLNQQLKYKLIMSEILKEAKVDSLGEKKGEKKDEKEDDKKEKEFLEIKNELINFIH